MEGWVYKQIDKLPQFVTTFKNCSIDFKPNDAKISEFCSFFTANLYESTKESKFKIADEVRISK